jgi:beta-glucosidase
MKKSKHILFAIGLCCIVSTAFAQKKLTKPQQVTPKPTVKTTETGIIPYKNANLPIPTRVADLLKRMTLEEKVAQMLCHWEPVQRGGMLNDKNEVEEAKIKVLAPNGLGQVARPNEAGTGFLKGLDAFGTATNANNIQKYFVEKTRLGIPVMFHEESLHGNQAKDATHFPTHIALGSTWNEALLTDIYTAIAEEVRLRGAHHVLAPVVDLARDPRWGRTEECLGEDPYHVSRLAVAEIKAYQGGTRVDKVPAKHVVSTLKHFGAHGASEGGHNVAPVFADERTMREVYFPSFEACVKEAGALSLMPCYNELSGIPAHSNKWMLTDILRKEWGFKGLIVSDYNALNDLKDLHKVAKDAQEASRLALMAGVDIETPNIMNYKNLVEQVKAGKVSQAAIDMAVERILTMKFKMGLFENPYTNPEEARRVVGCEANRQLALKAAQESMVLLKNDGILPISKGKYKKIAVVGPNAARCILGGYADIPKQTISPLQGLQQYFGAENIIYTEGVRLTDKGNWFSDSKDVVASSPEDNAKRIQEAIEAVRGADIILYFGGANEAVFREGWASNHFGDIPDIDLFGQQNELILELKKLGKPMVGFVLSGPPLACKTLDDNANALVQCWFLGQETGTAIADLVSGTINPSGKLPITIPRSVGHIPAYYSYKPSARRGYHLTETKPLYPFGFGLSYTTYKYENLRVSSPKVKKGQNVTVSIDVTNTGNRDGMETVQLYIRDVVSSVTRPVKELKDFSKITLKSGEKKTVTFTITQDKLQFYNLNMKRVVEAGDFEVMVGSSSEDLQKVTFEVLD